MAMKLRVNERCGACGQREARKFGNCVLLDHNCPNGPPGPRDPPRTFRADEVVFQPFDFDSAFLRQELEAAWLRIDELLDKRWEAERRAMDAVREAMKTVYNPSVSA